MGASPWVILTHAGHVAVTEGFLSAAKRLGLPVVLLTDHRLDDLEYSCEGDEQLPRIHSRSHYYPRVASRACASRFPSVRSPARTVNWDFLGTDFPLSQL